MNLAIILILCILVGLLAFLIFASVKNIKQVDDSKQVFVIDTNTKQYCYPEQNIFTLASLEAELCCVSEGNVTQIRSFNLVNGNLPVLVGEIPIKPETACFGFCQNYNSDKMMCQDPINSQYDICISTLTAPKDCTFVAAPVARLDTTPYYAVGRYVAGEGICQSLTACP